MKKRKIIKPRTSKKPTQYFVISNWLSHPEWLRQNPDELRQSIYSHFKDSRKSGFKYIEKTLFENLEKEAQHILNEKNIPTDLNDLWWYQKEYDMDMKSLCATNILFTIAELKALLRGCSECKELIDANLINDTNKSHWELYSRRGDNIDTVVNVFIETLRLIQASIMLVSRDFIEWGQDVFWGRLRGQKSDKKKHGIEEAILSVLKENPKLSAQKIWNNLSLYYDYEKKTSFKKDQYEVYFKNGKCFQVKDGKKQKGIVFDSFRNYVKETKSFNKSLSNNLTVKK